MRKRRKKSTAGVAAPATPLSDAAIALVYARKALEVLPNDAALNRLVAGLEAKGALPE